MKRLFLVFALCLPVSATAQSPQDLFQQGLRLERSQGDLLGAIALYQRVATDFAGDRALGAQALFRIGQAYEQLGETEATRAYRRIVREFADQADTVAMAEAALGRLVAPAVATAPFAAADSLVNTGSALSRDGRFLVFTDWNTARLAYLEAGKTQIQYVTNKRDDGSTASWGRFSPDNQRIAYAWDEDSDGSESVRVFDRSTGETSEILHAKDSYVRVFDWSTDGQRVLVERWLAANSVRLGLVDVGSGVFGPSVVLDRFTSDIACLLNDRYVLFDDESRSGDHILRADLMTGEVSTLLPPETQSQLLGCSSEQQMVALRSDEFGVYTAWLSEVSNGQLSDSPKPLVDIPTDAEPLGGLITRTGALPYLVMNWRTSMDVFRYSLESRTVVSRVESLPLTSSIYGLGWTRDGTRLAARYGQNRVLIREANGDTTVVKLARGYQRLRWLPDGSGLLGAWNHAPGNPRPTSFSSRITLPSGVPADTLAGIYASTGFDSQDLLIAERKDADTMCIWAVPGGAESRQEVLCYPDDRSIFAPGWLGLSPDQNRVAVVSREQGSEEVAVRDRPPVIVTVVDLGTGEPRVVADGTNWRWWEWLPDGSGFIVHEWGGEFYYVSIESGNSERLFERFGSVRSILDFVLHPKDDLILLRSRPRTTRYEFKIQEGLWDEPRR